MSNVRKRNRREKLYHENHVYTMDKLIGNTKYYRCARRGELPCSGRCRKVNDTVTLTQGHTCVVSPGEQAKDAALAKLKELTLASESVRAIEIVRKVLKEMPPEARQLMPSEDSLRRRVTRWAQQAKIEVIRPTAEDWVRNENAKQNPEVTSTEGNGDGNLLANVDKPSLETSASLANIKTEVDIDENNVEEFENGLKILRDKKINGRYRIMIRNQIYNWKRDYSGRALYTCREARIGCPVTATIFNEDNRYFIKGKHKHDRPLVPKPKIHRKKMFHGIKMVDEEGNQIGVVNSIDDIPATSFDGSSNPGVVQWLNPLSSKGIHMHEPATNTNVEGPTMDDGDDFQADFDPVDSMEPEPVSFNDTISTNKTSKKSPEETAKSGERCYVCGDELLVCETLASSQETFRKACCYLNVKSQSEWFPSMNDTQFYSFCESCTTEITRIHQLYKKVDEIQSLIFKKVEDVEKRIADAEIVDNWMSDAPFSSASRFEGFRKQVLINYRNKLKVRREVRVGRKMGHNFMEIQPMRSAHMFATDPATTSAFSKLAPSDIDETPEPTARRGRGRPRKQTQSPDFQQDIVADSPHLDDTDDHIGFDDEWNEEEPDKETKFWKDDPSKLNLVNANTNEGEESMDAFDDPINGSDGDDNSDDTNDSDCSWQESEDEEDWDSDRKKKKKSKNSTGKCNQSDSKKEASTKRRKAKQKEQRFPDVIVTKDNRLFMQGIEIIKLPPGSYSRMPFNEVFMCGSCDKMMISFWKIREHICGHHLGMYKCHICEKEFAEPRLIPKHINRIHTERQKVPCEVCGRPTVSGDPQAMKYHIYTHLGAEEKMDPKYASYCPPYKKDPNRPKRVLAKNFQTFQCAQCGKAFYRPSALKRHELTHGGDALKVQCQHCGKMYAHKKALSDHLTSCSLNTTIPEQSYPCPKCPQRFKSRANRSKHLKNHDKPTPYSCLKCPRKFSSKNGFKQHKRLCTETTTTFSSRPASIHIKTDKGVHDSNVPSSPMYATASRSGELPTASSSQQSSISYFQDEMGILQYPAGFNMHH